MIKNTIALLLLAVPLAAQTERIVHADLAYQAPGSGPAPNFSPYGTQVKLTDLAPSAPLPEGAARPAKTGAIQVGPSQNSWIAILVTADAAHPEDFSRLYIDRNRNGNFDDDGPPLTAVPKQNEKTKAWWSSFNQASLSVLYGNGVAEPYMVNFWAVREGDALPAIIRYSVASWRSGTAKIAGVDAFVAVMDSDNNAIFDAKDQWSVLAASEPDAAKRVLNIKEVRHTDRFMFVDKGDGKELVLEFRSLSPDGRSIAFAIVDRPVTKAQDRAPDDTLAAERARPRTQQPFPWIENNFDSALAQAKQSGRKLIVDFWATWCGPCHQLDEWIWSDAEVADALNKNYVGLKLDGDLQKELVAHFNIEGYPTLLILDPTGKVIERVGYMSSKEMLAVLTR